MNLWRLASCLALAVLGACTTVTTGPDGQVRTPNEPADPERRARVRLELAGLYYSRGQLPTALEEIKVALAAKPDMAEAFSLRALVYASMGDPRLAEDSFLRALQLAPQDANTMHNFAWFYCQQRRYAEADAMFDAALAEPSYRDATRTLLAKGVCLARNGRWAEAERALNRAYELDPANPLTAYNLAEVLLRLGELERARFYVARIHSIPEQVTAQSLWLSARIERRLGNLNELRLIGRQMIERFPQAPETLLFERGQFDD